MKKVLIFARYYLPGFKAGGPIRSISNMVDNLGDAIKFYIVTTDRDAFETEAYNNIEPDTWTNIGKANVYYMSPSKRNSAIFRQFVSDSRFDIIYLNSFFDIEFSFRPLFLAKKQLKRDVKVIVAPRGEFSKGALRLKRTKKRLFIGLFKLLGLPENVVWQATSEGEVSDIRAALNSTKLQIGLAPNFSEHTVNDGEGVTFEGVLKIIYLSRISPKKNLHYAINILKGLDLKIQFDIYGLIDDEEYWAECERIIDSLPDDVSVAYHGPIPYQEVKKKMAEYHLFFLPTKGENYGHTIVEAMSCGVPVLISDQTPWLRLEEFGVGWDINLSEPTKFQSAIAGYYMSLKNNKPYDKQKVIRYIVGKTDSEPIKSAYSELFS